MKRIKDYFKRQITEIREDSALRIYGACLAIGNVLSYTNWKGVYIPKYLIDEPICWPFFESCHKLRFLNVDQINLVFSAFGIASVIGVILFFRKKTVTSAYWWLIGVNIFKTLIYITDYRLRMNQHYMLYFVTFAFLFLPHKRDLLRYLIVAFYVGAGSLKLNQEWLSGAGLYRDPLWIHGKFVPIACAYAAILETCFSYGLLVRRKIIFWATFIQIALFHLVSFPVVGPFYPLLMFGIIAIFPLTYFYERTDETPNLLRAFLTGRQWISTYVFIGLFVLGQLVPKIMPGDEKITGEGRLFSLHMFDAKVACEGQLTLKFRDGSVQEVEIPQKMKVRIKCDPVVNLSLARNQCRKYQNDANFENLDFYYEARLESAKDMRPLVDISDFCSKKIDYKMWRPNDWIIKYE